MKVKKAVLPVAGFGTRFLPATKSSSKEMLPLVDKPLIHYAVEDAVKAGIEQIIFITGRGKRAIEDYFDISFELEFHLKLQGKEKLIEKMRQISEMADFVYIRQKEPKGLGHAVLRAKDVVGNEPFAVILADDVIESKTSGTAQLVDVFNKYHCSVIGLEEVNPDDVSSYGIVAGKEIENGIFKLDTFVEKPKKEEAPSNTAIIGRYVFTPAIFEELEKTKPGAKGEIQLTDAIESLSKKEVIYGKVIEGKRFDCGSKLGFLKATIEFALNDKEVNKELTKYIKEVVKC
ncbi:UTP--glucose-1-phosphate uridylyltransferase GalU [Hippea maritima]|uniref:UTP--glucose-1-phosphate uridylyltransferase n=1 Tax=Hippea maritima (strain ATCC 700847 / DSM 10411 / MH2) TaxID=760142 RepID=F2LWH6_HIPMA|nr:UTP--glucose-1-phosphate uridylyltransferase GalU [Hippea maritima]AEA34085.1 UTP-glucose-1-phosphate uridylyltransferase [Hippea maritima DSM 10411]